MDSRIVQSKLELLHGVVATPIAAIEAWEARTADHVGPGEYQELGDWAALPLPADWPGLTTVFLRARFEPRPVPAGATLCLEIDHHDLEALLSVEGRPYAGIDDHHRRVPAPSTPAILEIEAVAAPSVRWEPRDAGNRGSFRGARLVALDEAAERAWLELDYARQTLDVLPPGRRRSRLERALEDALLKTDTTREQEEQRRQLHAAAGALRKQIAAIGRDDEGGALYMVGHTHIDTAWLWPVRETIRKCARTFATACRLMERFPQFHFSCSQAQLYAYTKAHYPALYDEMRRWIEAGRWHTTGAMWIEADCNVTSGESLVRQLLHGIRFFQEEFGTRPRCCWLPDVFGYPASLPQILSGAGVPYFFTYKLHWQSRNPFPAHLFQWEGIDGSRVLGHIPLLVHGYNGTPTPRQLQFAWDEFRQKDSYPELMFPYGYGDGGGGPTAEMVQQLEIATDYPGLPRCRTGGEETFFEEAAASGAVTRVWRGELYLETHRGTYTTHGDTKLGNRLCEIDLRDAELLGCAAAWAAAPVDLEPLRDAWKLTLLNQFHDILPGTSVKDVYVDTRAEHARARAAAAGVTTSAIDALTDPADDAEITVVNTLGWDRCDPVELSAPAGPATVMDAAGNSCPTQAVTAADGRTALLFAPGPVAGFSAAGFRVSTGAAEAASPFRIEARRIETPFFRAELADDGTITRLMDKSCDREIAVPGTSLNELQFFQDGPEREAAWNVHATYERCRYDADPDVGIEVVETGPVRAVIRIDRRFRDSTFVQRIVLYSNLRRIDFETEAMWRERHVMLKAAFPVAVRSPRATFEIQFGAVERPTHRNTSWDEEKFEVCGRRWADLSEPGYGVSLLNDCKYGHDVHDNCLRLTLLRGSDWPDPEADLGEHRFTYSLLPHDGDWTSGGTVRRAAELNTPWRLAAGRKPRATTPWLSLSGIEVVADTLKPAEDGRGEILRVYEPHGGRGRVEITPACDLRHVIETNLVEEDLAAVAVAADGKFAFELQPFQVRTFRLQRS